MVSEDFVWWSRFGRHNSSCISTTARSIPLKIAPPVSLEVGKLWFNFGRNRIRIGGVATISSFGSLVFGDNLVGFWPGGQNWWRKNPRKWPTSSKREMGFQEKRDMRNKVRRIRIRWKIHSRLVGC